MGRQAPGIPTRHVKDRPDRLGVGRREVTARDGPRPRGGTPRSPVRVRTSPTALAGQERFALAPWGHHHRGAVQQRAYRTAVRASVWVARVRPSVAGSDSPVKAFTSTERTEQRLPVFPSRSSHPRLPTHSSPTARRAVHPSTADPSISTPVSLGAQGPHPRLRCCLPASSASSLPPRPRPPLAVEAAPARGEEYSQVRGHLTCPRSDLPPRLNASPRLVSSTPHTLTPASPSLPRRRPGSHYSCGASELRRRVIGLPELSTQVGPVSCAEGGPWLCVWPRASSGADPWSYAARSADSSTSTLHQWITRTAPPPAAVCFASHFGGVCLAWRIWPRRWTRPTLQRLLAQVWIPVSS